MNILLVEDEEIIRQGVAEFLSESDYSIFEAESAEDGLKILNVEKIHLIILDIMLPGINGIDMLKEIRKFSNIPVIVLTALSDEQTQIKMFDEYADDYLVKPFSLPILKKRVESQLRRFYGEKEIFKIGEATVDFVSCEAYLSGKSVNLTTKEFHLLKLLLENKGMVLTREKILDNIWNHEEEPYERVIDVYIKNIRKKLQLNCISTVKGIGYKLEIL